MDSSNLMRCRFWPFILFRQAVMIVASKTSLGERVGRILFFGYDHESTIVVW